MRGAALPALPARPHALLLASHSLRSISRGSTTSSLNPKSVILDLVYSGSRYTFFSSATGFFPLGLALDFLRREGSAGSRQVQAWRPRAGPGDEQCRGTPRGLQLPWAQAWEEAALRPCPPLPPSGAQTWNPGRAGSSGTTEGWGGGHTSRLSRHM